MVVGFKTTYAISAYHHWSCEFESHSGEVYLIQHYVIKFDSDLRQVGGFLWVLWFPPPIKLPQYKWILLEAIMAVILWYGIHAYDQTSCEIDCCMYHTKQLYMIKFFRNLWQLFPVLQRILEIQYYWKKFNQHQQIIY